MPTAEEKAAAKAAKEQEKAAAKAAQSFFTVYKNDEPVRTYSVEVHGEEAEACAQEYAKKIGGEVR